MIERAPLLRSWLYVPGNSPRFLARAFETDADAVIFDLEDSVPPAEKDHARQLVREALAAPPRAARASVWVRVNAFGTDAFEADLAAVVGPGMDGVRLPKVDAPDAVRAAADLIGELERRAGLRDGATRLVCGIESAAGVAAAAEIAHASDRVQALAFGAADYCADIGVESSAEATLVARSLLVIASRSAGVAPPVDGAHLDLDDDEGLRGASLAARRLGFFGRSAIHPRQVPIINAAFRPGAAETARAREILAAAAGAADAGRGALRLPSGAFVDAAIERWARRVVELAEVDDVR